MATVILGLSVVTTKCAGKCGALLCLLLQRFANVLNRSMLHGSRKDRLIPLACSSLLQSGMKRTVSALLCWICGSCTNGIPATF